MGLFTAIKNKLYWKDHEDERQQLESEGSVLLTEFNDLVNQMNVSPDVHSYSQINERLFGILDWFEELDKRGCPYHLIGGAESKRKEIARAYNYGLNYAIKRAETDFDKAIELLNPAAENYSDCKAAIRRQEKNDKTNFNGTGARFLSILENHFIQNNFIEEPLIACGIPTEVVLSRNVERIESFKPKFASDEQKDDFNAYFIALKNRYRLAHEPLVDQSERATNINLHEEEKVYTRINCVTLHEEVVVSRNVNYGGLRWQYGLARGGNVTFTTNAIRNFRVQDIGALYMTDERLLFVGNQKKATVAIPLSSIVSYEMFRDGVLIRIANRQSGILLRFEPMERYQGILMLQDGMNSFISIIERIFGKNTDKKV